MKRTVSLKISATITDRPKLVKLQDTYSLACNAIVPFAKEHRCWNRVALHNLCYTKVRESSPLGSQMVCNAIYSVCKAYKAKKLTKKDEVPSIQFRQNISIHFDKRTYSLKGAELSLYTLEGRIKVNFKAGDFQRKWLEIGLPKEAELICKKGQWYFQLVLEIPETVKKQDGNYFAVDLGENNVAAMSSGLVIRGGKIRHERDVFLARRRKLQSNGTPSAKRLLKKISGREERRMRQTNHEISKTIIKEAVEYNTAVLVLENLTNIRKRIKARKRERTRLHRWSFAQLQTYIEYKAEAAGINVVYINPAYSSKLCLECGSIGTRNKHLFKCHCGNKQHSDLYACTKLCEFARSADLAMANVNWPMVAASMPATSSSL